MFFYDVEVFKNDFIVVLIDDKSDEVTIIHNDYKEVYNAFSSEDVYIGFNSKHYDQYIIKAICVGFSNVEIKALNDFLISGGLGFEFPLFELYPSFYFHNVDIRDDTQQGLSLKAIEGHLGEDIKETPIDFNIDRALTDDEVYQVASYCIRDVKATISLCKQRKNYILQKIAVGEIANIDPIKAMSLTNAKLTAMVLKAEPKAFDDERDYKIPENLKIKYIDKEVIAFIERLKDKSIPDDKIFNSKLKFYIDELEAVVGFGGIHGAIKKYNYKKGVGTNGHKKLINYDVASYYPNLMILYNYISRAIPDADKFRQIVADRLKAKKEGNKSKADALKLVINTTYGAMLNKYNNLYDPLQGRSVCITGQLFLIELAKRLITKVDGLKIVQLNTDGIMLEVDEDEKIAEIINEWQERTGFNLEREEVEVIFQKDVNNYLAVINGKIKKKGCI